MEDTDARARVTPMPVIRLVARLSRSRRGARSVISRFRLQKPPKDDEPIVLAREHGAINENL